MKSSESLGCSAKVAVISGGSSGIGLACARTLLERGYRVALLARDPDRLMAVQCDLERHHPNFVEVIAVDVTDANATRAAINEIYDRWQRIDWLITSAGVVEPGLFRDLDLQAHRMQMETNYFGSLHLIQAAAPLMAGGNGRITLVSSGAAFIGIAGYSGYAPGKFAVRALAEILNLELAPQGVAVSLAIPPDTDTPQLDGEHAKRPMVTKLIAQNGGMMNARDVAKSLIRQAERGNFILAPSQLMAWLGYLHSLYRPILMWKQRRLLRQCCQDAPSVPARDV